MNALPLALGQRDQFMRKRAVSHVLGWGSSRSVRRHDGPRV
jgi:hypothetical protein